MLISLFLRFNLSIVGLPISSFATVTASGYQASLGSATAQGDGLVNRPNTTDGTHFCAGGYAPQYVQLGLPGQYNITSVFLQVNQYGYGYSEHLLYVGSNLPDLTLAANFSGVIIEGQWINTTFNPPLTGVQYLRLNSISSPAWIAWYKFIVYDE
jgi:hypothetical protein